MNEINSILSVKLVFLKLCIRGKPLETIRRSFLIRGGSKRRIGNQYRSYYAFPDDDPGVDIITIDFNIIKGIFEVIFKDLGLFFF